MLRVIKLVNKNIGFRVDLFHAEAALNTVIPELLPRIPIFIIGKKPFDAITRIEYKQQENGDDKVPSEALACYIKDFKTNVLLTYYPKGEIIPNVTCNAILICEERIMAYADILEFTDLNGISQKYSKGALMSAVLIHEFGHAYFNIAEPDNFKYGDPSDPLKLYDMCEESWANNFMLSVIDSYLTKVGFCRKEGADKFFSLAVDFAAHHQPTEYELGWFLWSCGIKEYDLWAYNNHKKDIWCDWISFAKKEFTSTKDKAKMCTEWENTKSKLRI